MGSPEVMEQLRADLGASEALIELKSGVLVLKSVKSRPVPPELIDALAGSDAALLDPEGPSKLPTSEPPKLASPKKIARQKVEAAKKPPKRAKSPKHASQRQPAPLDKSGESAPKPPNKQGAPAERKQQLNKELQGEMDWLVGE